MHRLVRWASVCLWLLAATPGECQDSVTFLHITDTHVTSQHNTEPVVELLAHLSDGGKPAFVVNTGDVTELGTEAEFQAYKRVIASSPVPVYAVPGNHDVRWAPTGKEAFESACGRLYQSFDYGGCHFVLMDSTVVLEHWGHFDGAQLDWLRNDLRHVGTNTPVFFFFHHWLGRVGTNIDNAAEFLEIIAPYNVVAIFVGHGHADLKWEVNGIPCFMARGLYQGSHHEIRVAAGKAEVYRLTGKAGATARTLLEARALSGHPQRRVAFAWVDHGKGPKRSRVFRTALTDGARPVASAQATWCLDGGKPAAMARRTPGDLWYMQEMSDEGVASGWHVLDLTVIDNDGRTYTREVPFQVSRGAEGPATVWERRTGSTIQGSPVLSEETLYVSSCDAHVYALDARSGRVRWAYRTGGPVYATPCVTDALVVTGSTDHYVYAVDRRRGRLRWRFDAGSPVLATAAFADGIFCVGANRAIYGIDATTGKAVWRVPTGSFFQSKAAAANGVFVLGGWDNAVYAVEARSGNVRWKVQMGRTNGGRGTLSFYYSPAIASPCVGDGRVYVCTNDGVLHALSLDTGTEVWTTRAPAGGDTFGYSSPLFHEGRIYVGGLGEKGQGDCYALDAATGTLGWRCSTGADNYDSGPALSGDHVVIGSVRGRLTWIERATGKVAAYYQPRPGYSFTTPVSDGRWTYTASMNGTVTAVSHVSRDSGAP